MGAPHSLAALPLPHPSALSSSSSSLLRGCSSSGDERWSSDKSLLPLRRADAVGSSISSSTTSGKGPRTRVLAASTQSSSSSGTRELRKSVGNRSSTVGGTARVGSRGRSRTVGGTNERNGAAAQIDKAGGRLYFNFTGFPFPLRPFVERRTIRYEIERGSIWTFEQEQGLGFSSVTTNTRMTVIRLKTGGLWVHAPIAPTQECIRLLRELDMPVEHIVLPTFAYEHKIFVAPFARRFPNAKVWTAPQQWSWPVNLPLPLLGVFGSKALEVEGGEQPEWAEEIEYKVLTSPEVGIGPYVEVAFFHRRMRTLLVTDAVIQVPTVAPDVVPPAALLAAAENGLAVQVLSAGQEVPKVVVDDTPFFRSLGWQRMVLQILYFGPSNLLDPSDSFNRIAGRLIVSPVVKTLVFEKVPDKVLAWVESIAQDWNFTRIIPCHFSAPIRASPADFRRCFGFLDPLVTPTGSAPPAPELTPAKGLFGLPSLPPVPGFLQGLVAPVTPASAAAAALYPKEDLATLASLDRTLVSLGVVKSTSSRNDDE